MVSVASHVCAFSSVSVSVSVFLGGDYCVVEWDGLLLGCCRLHGVGVASGLALCGVLEVMKGGAQTAA